jgi:hypothetical protein
MLNIFSKEVNMKKIADSPDFAVRSAAAAVGLNSVESIAEATGIPRSTLARKLKLFSTFTAGELSALMNEFPSLTDEKMGKLIREVSKH